MTVETLPGALTFPHTPRGPPSSGSFLKPIGSHNPQTDSPSDGQKGDGAMGTACHPDPDQGGP